MTDKNETLKGSALIITLLVVAVLSVVAFGIGQLFVSQARVTISFEETQGAFYAAQAGLEEGRRRFAGDRNTEIVTAFSESLGTGSYQMTMGYKQTNPSFSALAKDDTREIDTTGLESQGVARVLIAPTWEASANPRFLEVQKVSGVTNAFDQRVCPVTESPCVVALTGTAKIRVKPLGASLTAFAVATDPAVLPIDAGTTTVASTGTFGRTKRKLEALINRRTGALTSVFDHALFSRQSIQ